MKMKDKLVAFRDKQKQPEQKKLNKRFLLGFLSGLGVSLLTLVVAVSCYAAANGESGGDKGAASSKALRTNDDGAPLSPSFSNVVDLSGTTWTWFDDISDGYNYISVNVLYSCEFYNLDGTAFNAMQFSLLGGSGNKYGLYASSNFAFCLFYRDYDSEFVAVYDTSYGWYDAANQTIEFDDVTDSPSAIVNLLNAFATLDVGGDASSSSEASSSASLSGSTASSEATYEAQYESVSVPYDYWPYRLLNGSYDANTGACFVSTPFNLDGAFRQFGGIVLGGIPFYIGNTLFDAVRFRFMSLYGMRYVDFNGNVQSAVSVEGFKNIVALRDISVRQPDGETWLTIAMASYGVDADGNQYVNAHALAWQDLAYKTYKVEVVDALVSSNYAFVDYMGDEQLNASILGLTRSEAFKLAFTGNSGVTSTSFGDANNNVFVLLGNAFDSVANIFAIGVLPGLTIGTLLFVPLVVLVVLAIIKILGK